MAASSSEISLVSETTFQHDPEPDERKDYGTVVDDAKLKTPEDVFNKLGLSRFHFKLALIAGWANATDSVEVMCISLVLPSAQCDLDMTSGQLGWLSAIVFLGMMIGGYLWGSLGDTFGRRNVLSLALLINAIFGILSAFSLNFAWFVVCRFISGIGVGGTVPVLWSYFIEFQPAKTRGSMLSLIATFWMVGQLFVGGLGWLIIPQSGWYFYLGSLKFSSWRIFVVLSTLTCVTSAGLILLLPKSPKYLLGKGRVEAAIKVLEIVYSDEKTRPQFKILKIETLDIELEHDATEQDIFDQAKTWEKTKLVLKQVWFHTSTLFTKQYLRTTVSLLIIYFSLSFGYYGLSLWFPELFALFQENGSTGSLCSDAGSLNSTSSGSGLNCSLPIDQIVFRNDFLVALSSLPGNLLTIFFIDKIGRKPLFVFALIASAISAFMIWFVNTSAEILAMSCVFSAVSVIAWNCLDALGSESYPTFLRSTAMGIGLMLARIGAIVGNVLFGVLINTHCEIPLLIVASLLTVGAAMSFFLPELKQKRID